MSKKLSLVTIVLVVTALLSLSMSAAYPAVPKLLSIDPPDGATNVALNPKITATFASDYYNHSRGQVYIQKVGDQNAPHSHAKTIGVAQNYIDGFGYKFTLTWENWDPVLEPGTRYTLYWHEYGYTDEQIITFTTGGSSPTLTPIPASTTAPHNASVADARAEQATTLTFTAPAQAQANSSFTVSGSLTAGGKGIGDACIHVQSFCPLRGAWWTFGNWATDGNGDFAYQIILTGKGHNNLRVTYDGDDHYAPSVSNEVVVTVS